MSPESSRAASLPSVSRREFAAGVLAGTAFTGLTAPSGAAKAQGVPVEGKHFVRLSQPVGVSVAAGKIEVLEFFWYGCPHCNAFQPLLEEWVKRLPADVVFRRVPVAFSATHEAHQKMYYALEAMGALEQIHKRVFAAIHNGRQRLDREADQIEFVKANGLDAARFGELLKSFSVQTRARQARQLAEGYRIDGVPALGVQGRFYTAGSLAGNNQAALAVADFLIQRVRKG